MVVELVKVIKPRKLQVDKVRQNILKTLQAEGRGIAREFDKTTATWQGERPKFEVLIGLTGNDATVVVGPSGSDKAVNKWVWLDKGTKPHLIRARNKPRLVFKAGYSPKTKVGAFTSFPGGSYGPTVATFQVQHPGTEARGWSKLIVKQRQKRFKQNLAKAAQVIYG